MEVRLLEGHVGPLVGAPGRLVSDPNRAGLGLIKSVELAKQSRLAAPARPEHGDNFTGGHIEVHPVQHWPVEA